MCKTWYSVSFGKIDGNRTVKSYTLGGILICHGDRSTCSQSSCNQVIEIDNCRSSLKCFTRWFGWALSTLRANAKRSSLRYRYNRWFDWDLSAPRANAGWFGLYQCSLLDPISG